MLFLFNFFNLLADHPSLKGGYLTPHHPPVFCAIDMIIGKYRVLILSMSRVFIFSLCCVKFLVCVMFSFVACVVCSFSTTTRPTADGGRFAPAGLASRAWSLAHCALPQVPPPVQYEGGGDVAIEFAKALERTTFHSSGRPTARGSSRNI